jgi:acyl-coenzyme A synthetase/AMP-(fatty) acid ligase
MGYRIEAGEIEAALDRLEGIERSVVVYKRNRQNFGEIIGFVIVRDNRWTENEVREALREYLPSYMIPQRVKFRLSFPHNANGKIDRTKLFDEV